MSVSISTSEWRGLPVVSISGDLEGVACDDVEAAVMETARAAGCCAIVDLAGLTFLDSQGFGRLLRVHILLEQTGGDIALVMNNKSEVARVVRMFGADYLMAVFEDLDSAAEYLLPLLEQAQ